MSHVALVKGKGLWGSQGLVIVGQPEVAGGFAVLVPNAPVPIAVAGKVAVGGGTPAVLHQKSPVRRRLMALQKALLGEAVVPAHDTDRVVGRLDLPGVVGPGFAHIFLLGGILSRQIALGVEADGHAPFGQQLFLDGVGAQLIVNVVALLVPAGRAGQLIGFRQPIGGGIAVLLREAPVVVHGIPHRLQHDRSVRQIGPLILHEAVLPAVGQDVIIPLIQAAPILQIGADARGEQGGGEKHHSAGVEPLRRRGPLRELQPLAVLQIVPVVHGGEGEIGQVLFRQVQLRDAVIRVRHGAVAVGLGQTGAQQADLRRRNGAEAPAGAEGVLEFNRGDVVLIDAVAVGVAVPQVKALGEGPGPLLQLPSIAVAFKVKGIAADLGSSHQLGHVGVNLLLRSRCRCGGQQRDCQQSCHHCRRQTAQTPLFSSAFFHRYCLLLLCLFSLISSKGADLFRFRGDTTLFVPAGCVQMIL